MNIRLIFTLLLSIFSRIKNTDAIKWVVYDSETISTNVYPLQQDPDHGYNVKATLEVCKMAAEELGRKIAQDVKPEQVGDCKSHLVYYPGKVTVSHRRRYLSLCPATPPFYLKNVGADQWTGYYKPIDGDKNLTAHGGQMPRSSTLISFSGIFKKLRKGNSTVGGVS